MPVTEGQAAMFFTDEQTMIRDMARKFSETALMPHAADNDRTGEVPHESLQEMAALGLLGMCVPEQWGGAGADFLSYILALEEIAAGDGAVSTIMSVNNSPMCQAVMDYGTDAQKERFLKPMASGESIGAFLLTEPQAGSDASNLRTRAERRNDGYILSGQKQFITSGQTAKIAMAFAVTDPEAGKKGISCFLFPTDSAGYVVARNESKLGQRASDTCQITLDGLHVTDDMMLGAPGDGYRIALANLSTGRIGIAAQSIGMARAAFEAARDYAKERTAFGKAIIDHQAVGFRLADMATQIEAARQMTHYAARLKSAGEPCLKEASMAKLFASEMAEKVCTNALQTHGGYGYLNDFPVERIYRDVRVCQIYEGTSDVQRLLIARELAR